MTIRIPVHQCGHGRNCHDRAVVVAWAIVDDEDAHLARHFWTISDGYARRTLPGADRKNSKLHHEVIGKPPPGWHTSHLDADKLNCRRSNLSHVTHSRNRLNLADPIWKTNTSGSRGVSMDATTRSRNKWRGVQVVDRVVHRTRRCETREEAEAELIALRERLGVRDESAVTDVREGMAS